MLTRLSNAFFCFGQWCLSALLGFSLGLISILLFLAWPELYAAAGVVTNTDNSGVGSLRQAIADAAPGDVITFDSSLSGQTIVLSGTLVLDKDVTIDGSGVDDRVTLSGGDIFRVITVTTGAEVAISKLVIAHGRVEGPTQPPIPPKPLTDGIGGGLVNNGILTIVEVTFAHNQAGSDYGRTSGSSGAVRNHGILTIINSTFQANHVKGGQGGAIENYGQMLVRNSTFADNYVYRNADGRGGAIFNAATLTVTSSTFSSNIATSDHGGHSGGGIDNEGTLWVYNSTFSNNQATSLNTEDLGGSGIDNRGTLHLYNTLIANGAGFSDCRGDLATNINNLIEDGSCGAALSGDPTLGPLDDYGGNTLTHALLPGSPAIDAGDNTTCLATDQRDAARPFDGDSNGSALCDIGAYEALSPVLATATATVTPTPTDTPSPTATATQTPTPTSTVPTLTPTVTVVPTIPTVPSIPAQQFYLPVITQN
ncbi:MAG: hypothetical protein KF832_04420 [Caldilineaceae bacterium]|nr:hypothetical protein [Caldilineaceae bacterium]